MRIGSGNWELFSIKGFSQWGMAIEVRIRLDWKKILLYGKRLPIIKEGRERGMEERKAKERKKNRDRERKKEKQTATVSRS